MKGLFGQLLQSMSERTEKKIADLLPRMVGKDLATLVAKAVETEVRTHMGASLSEERLTQVLEPLLMTALPKVLSREMSLLEPIIRHSIFETATPLIKERIDQFVREEINAVRTALSDMVREHLGSIEGLVKEEIQQAAAKQTSEWSKHSSGRRPESRSVRLFSVSCQIWPKSRSKQRSHDSHKPPRTLPRSDLPLLALLTLIPSGCRQCLHPRDILPMLFSRLAVFFTPCGHSLSKL